MAVGDPVCKNGISTNTTCGAITAIGQDRPLRDFDGAIGNLTNQTVTNVCAIPGDSGGGVVVSGRAYGITSLGNAIENDAGTFRCRNAKPTDVVHANPTDRDPPRRTRPHR